MYRYLHPPGGIYRAGGRGGPGGGGGARGRPPSHPTPPLSRVPAPAPRTRPEFLQETAKKKGEKQPFSRGGGGDIVVMSSRAPRGAGGAVMSRPRGEFDGDDVMADMAMAAAGTSATAAVSTAAKRQRCRHVVNGSPRCQRPWPKVTRGGRYGHPQRPRVIVNGRTSTAAAKRQLLASLCQWGPLRSTPVAKHEPRWPNVNLDGQESTLVAKSQPWWSNVKCGSQTRTAAAQSQPWTSKVNLSDQNPTAAPERPSPARPGPGARLSPAS